MKVLVPLADGFEEIEAIAIVDVLRRAGLDVVMAGLPGTMVRGSRNVKIIADAKMDDVNPDEFDALVLPGGDPGYKNLGQSQKILNMIRDFHSQGKLVCAICASPLVLAKAGILEDKKATVYPGLERDIPKPRGDRVVVDGNIITSQGPGTAIEFALKIVESLLGKDRAEMVRKQIVF